MKIAKTVLLTLLITLINVSSVLAGQPVGPPAPRAAGIPPPPGGAIDQNLMILLVAALFFGIYTIYRYNINKKASI
jgi:hypothetical protein